MHVYATGRDYEAKARAQKVSVQVTSVAYRRDYNDNSVGINHGHSC